MSFLRYMISVRGCFPTTIKADQAGEFLEDSLRDFCKTNGIRMEFSASKIPVQNKKQKEAIDMLWREYTCSYLMLTWLKSTSDLH